MLTYKSKLLARLQKIDIWNSPTLMTWLSYSTKALTLLGILPLVLRKFSPEDVVLWYLYATIISLSNLADFGFRQTFSRIISFAYGGASSIDIIESNLDLSSEDKLSCNKSLLGSIMGSMMFIYVRLTVISFVLMSTLGTWSMIKPISKVVNTNDAWVAWAVIVFTTSFSFFTKVYLNFLEGLNKIALVRRVETVTSLGSIVTSIAVLIWSPTLLNVVIANQFWVIVASIRDWYLCKKVDNSLFDEVNKKGDSIDSVILKKIWKPAWRSGVGGLMSAGVANLVSVIYAQVGNTEAVAAYLLAIRIINQIRDISMAPFYSKLPLLAVYRVKNDMAGLVSLVKKGMRMSHLVFLIGFLGTALCIDFLLSLIHSEVQFVSMDLWGLIGLAYFFHRFGAMHLQVYISTNHVISHIADGISGLLFIFFALLLIPYIGIYSIPISMLIGYGGFYCWYTTYYSYKSINNNSFFEFEKTVSFPSMIGLLLFLLVAYWNQFIS